MCVWGGDRTHDNDNISRANKCFENVTHLRYLEATPINQNYFRDEIRCR